MSCWWINTWMDNDGQMNGQMDEWMDRQMNGWMNEWMDGQVCGRMINVWMNGRMDE